MAQRADDRDGRDKPGHGQVGTATSFAPLTSLGPNPKGYLIFLPEGRMIGLLVSPDRKPATNDAESAALLRTMISYSGKCSVDAKFITTPDVSWHESYTGREQVRYYKLDGN